MLIFRFRILTLALSASIGIGCGPDDSASQTDSATDSATDSETTFGDSSDAGAPETDEEKVMRLAETWWTTADNSAAAFCDCQVQGGVETYDACIATVQMANPPGLRDCYQGLMVENAGPELIAFLECSVERDDTIMMCYTSELCSDGGGLNETINQCYTDALTDSDCPQFLPEGFVTEFEQKCL